jgi:enoyl-CoA hydratase
MEQHVVVEELDRVALVRFHRPQVLNALAPDTFLALERIWNELESHPNLRAVIFTGEGEKAFVAGADVTALSDMDSRQVASFLDLGNRVLDRIESSRLLSVACLHGFALGGGLELALACDFIFAGDKAVLGFPEVSLGLIPGFGALRRLPLRVGIPKAKKLLLLGRQITAEEAFEIGLVDRLSELDSLLPSTLLFFEELLKGPSKITQSIKRGLLYPDESDPLFIKAFQDPEAKKRIEAFVERKGKKSVVSTR